MEQFIVEAVQNEVQGCLSPTSPATDPSQQRELPVIGSKKPGTLDLSSFDFDDLLA